MAKVKQPPACFRSTCRWFLLCDQPATKVREHPILGPVPICDRCNTKINNLKVRDSNG